MKSSIKRKNLIFVVMLICCIFVITGCGKDAKLDGNRWFVESYAPSSSYAGNEGDMFLDSTTYDIYQMTSGSWNKIGNIAGTDGEDGESASVEISDDGYWVINGTKTTTKASAQNGTDGKNGTNGTTPTIEISDDGYWIINKVITETKAVGQDGKTPTVELDEYGYLFINGENTDIHMGEYVCKRAKKLHTEECKYTDSGFCYETGYVADNLGTTIEYGNLGTSGQLNSGDAFDCDVNGDGIYNPDTERFYYVSELNSNSKYGVLIYSSNTIQGEQNTATAVAYNSNQTNTEGPLTAYVNLPTSSQWSNVSLFQTKRTITNEVGGNTTNMGEIVSTFDYSGYSARFLTAQEVNDACNMTVSATKIYNGKLEEQCQYMLENTKYSSSTNLVGGYWLETPRSTNSTLNSKEVWNISSEQRTVYVGSAHAGWIYGVRPVIEVPKAVIEFKF